MNKIAPIYAGYPAIFPDFLHMFFQLDCFPPIAPTHDHRRKIRNPMKNEPCRDLTMKSHSIHTVPPPQPLKTNSVNDSIARLQSRHSGEQMTLSISPPLLTTVIIEKYARPTTSDMQPVDLETMLSISPIELLERLFSHLSFADIHRLRLSGFGASNNEVFMTLRNIARGRRHALSRIVGAMTLRDVWRSFGLGWAPLELDWTHPVLNRSNQVWHSLPSPREFADLGAGEQDEKGDETRGLFLSRLTHEDVRVVAMEMPNLRNLNVVRWTSENEWDYGRNIPDTLGECQQLRWLRLFNLNDTKSLPEGVLRLRRLERLEVLGCRQPFTLPDNMGERMSALRYVKLHHMVKSVPVSLIDTVERNFKTCSIRHGIECLGDDALLQEFLADLRANVGRFPKLNANIRIRGAVYP